MNPAGASRRRVALLTNFVGPPYVPSLKALADRVAELKIFVSTSMEGDREWVPAWDSLDVTVQHCWTLRRPWRHPAGFTEYIYTHIPYDTLWRLYRYRPDVVISGELGLRTAQALLYRTLRPSTHLVARVAVSEHTERNRGMLRGLLRRWILPRVDSVVVNGRSGARYVRRFGVREERIVCAPYSMGDDSLSRLSLVRSAAEAHRLLFVGQLIERKGLTSFLDVLRRWALKHPESFVEFWVAGSGPMRATLERIEPPRNVAIRFLGNLHADELATLYGRSGILAFPTLSDEWGLVVAEAMAAGLPVLGSLYSQAVEELVRDGVNGWVFRPDHVDEVYAALDRALSTPIGVLDTMREAARVEAQQFTPGLIADRLVRSFSMSERRKRPH